MDGSSACGIARSRTTAVLLLRLLLRLKFAETCPVIQSCLNVIYSDLT